MFRIRYSLSTFLWLSIVLGAVGGLLVRAYLFHTHYELKNFGCGGYSVTSMWRIDNASSEELVYLLVFPEGNRAGGGSTADIHDKILFGGGGVHCNTTGIHVGSYNKTQSRPGCRFWIYETSSAHRGGDIHPVEVPADFPPLRRQDLPQLAKSKLWQEWLLPEVKRESQRFDEWLTKSEAEARQRGKNKPVPW